MKAKVSGSVRVDAYRVVARAVEEGVAYGLNRAYKYTEEPTREGMAEALETSIMNSLCEVMNFDQ